MQALASQGIAPSCSGVKDKLFSLISTQQRVINLHGGFGAGKSLQTANIMLALHSKFPHATFVT